MRKRRSDFRDYTGMVFGRLTVLGFDSTNARGESKWKCICKCGGEIITLGKSLKHGNTQSCGCFQKEQQLKALNGNTFRRKRPYEWLYSILLRNAKKIHKECQLSYNDFLHFTQISKCHYCGDEITWSKYRGHIDSSHGYFLDRRDNNIGYTNENCVVCCSLCNHIKGGFLSHDEMLLIGNVISKIKQSRQHSIHQK